jgi:hypothetical protein
MHDTERVLSVLQLISVLPSGGIINQTYVKTTKKLDSVGLEVSTNTKNMDISM